MVSRSKQVQRVGTTLVAGNCQFVQAGSDKFFQPAQPGK